MFYALNENVYFVSGKVRGCIYDFNSAKLYNLNADLTEKFKLINAGKISTDLLDDELKKVLQKFIELKILFFSEKPVMRQIEEIKLPDTKCNFAWIEITNRCNLKCLHCYNESEPSQTDTMSLENYKIVIDALLKLGIEKIQIIGGEPFFDSSKLKSMLNYTVGKFKFIEIFTNGTLITEDWFKFLAENKICVALSIYSYNADEHDKVTKVAGSWARTNKTVAALKKFNIPYRVCNVLMKDVYLGESSTDLYKLSDKKDVVRLTGRANFSLLTDDLLKKKLITKKTFSKKISKDFCARLISSHNCFGSKIYISANLEIFPCVMERRFKHGAINSSGEIILQDAIKFLNKDKIIDCKDCEFRYACFDCRADSLSEDIFAKPYYCTYNPSVGEWMDEDDFILKLRKNFEVSNERLHKIL